MLQFVEPSPKYFPARCSRGHRPFLAVSATRTMGGFSPRCPECNSESSLMPGAFYTSSNRARFEFVVDALEAARLTPTLAAAAADRIARAMLDGTEVNAVALLRENATLEPLEVLIPVKTQELIGFLGLLVTLLDSYATCRRAESSGEHLVIGLASTAREPAHSLPSGTGG